MWTPATHKNYSRNGLRYQSDVTDEEWRVIEPYLPPAKGIGRPRGWPLREIVNGIFYVDALWLSVAPVAEGPSALEHGLSLVCSLARCLPVREDQPCAGYNGIASGSGAKPVLRPRSSTARASRPRRLAARAVMMPARRSTGSNVMRWLTRTGGAS